MCGRAMVTISRREVGDLLAVDRVVADELPFSWNIAPTQMLYVARRNSQGERLLMAARWGLVPHWAASMSTGAPLINARAETLSARPAFCSLLGTRRALIPVSGFYEWRRRGEASQPFCFRPTGGPVVVFAGLWDRWRGPAGEVVESCTIVTTTANRLMGPVHHRMPVVLAPKDWDEWLAPAPPVAERLRALLCPAPEGVLESYPVSALVNNPANNGPALVERGEEPQLPLFA